MNEQQHWILTDVARGIDLVDFAIHSADFAGTGATLAISKRRLQAGLQAGVDVVDLSWGDWSLTLLPTRGMGVWRAQYADVPLRWQSPVRGPVHPRFVPLYDPSGLGWLDGFDEFVVRCGLTSNGAPEFDEQGQLLYPLHGRIANQPAHFLEVTLDPETRSVTLKGIVEESRFHFQKLRLTSSVRLVWDQPTLQLRDQIENYSAAPATIQMLYHNNIGTPFLGNGSLIHAPALELVPRNDHAAADIGRWNAFGEPEAGGAERVYLMKLAGDDRQQTQVVLTSPDQQRGIGVAYSVEQLPCFTLWKNEVGTRDGYVTGLEPGTNYPNPHSFERQRGRVVELGPGTSYDIELAYRIFADGEAVEQAVGSVRQLMQGKQGVIHPAPQAEWCA